MNSPKLLSSSNDNQKPARDGERVRLGFGVIRGAVRLSSGLTETMYSFLSSSPNFSWHCIGSTDGELVAHNVG
jgi:hypothetical protein